MAKAGSYKKENHKKMKKIGVRSGGKGAKRGPSGTKRNVTKAPSSKIQGTVKY